MYHNPQAVVQVNGKRTEVFAIERSVRQGCPSSPLLYVLAFESLLSWLRDERASPALRGILFAGPLSAKVSTYVDDRFAAKCMVGWCSPAWWVHGCR